MLACDLWAFNLNFFFLPKRIRKMMDAAGIPVDGSTYELPDEISEEVRQSEERRTAGSKRQQKHCTTFLHN